MIQTKNTHAEITAQLTPILTKSNVSEEVQNALLSTFTQVVEKRLDELESNLQATYDSKLEELEESSNKLIEEARQAGENKLISFMDKYADHVVESIVTSPKFGVVDKAKAELTESLLSGISKIMKDNAVSVPSNNAYIDNLTETNKQLTKKIHQIKESNMLLYKKNQQSIVKLAVEELMQNHSVELRDYVFEQVKDISFDKLETAIQLCLSGLNNTKTEKTNESFEVKSEPVCPYTSAL